MGDDPEVEEAESAPPPPGPNKVEITVAGHTVVVESADALDDVVGYALSLYEQTCLEARRIPFGFATGVAQVERAEPYSEPGGQQGWEEERGRGLGRQSAKDGATRRLVFHDSPGGHRTRLRPMPMDREQRPLPRARD